MSQPPFSSPDDQFPATGAAAGSRPTSPEVPPIPPMPTAAPSAGAGQYRAEQQNPWPSGPDYSQPATPPQQNAPSYQQTSLTWGGAGGNAAAWEQQPGQTSPYGTYATPYSQPQYPQYGQQLGAPLGAGKKTLGVVALIFGLIASFGSALMAFLTGGPAVKRFGEYVTQYGPIEDPDLEDIDLSFFAPVRDSILWAEVSMWIGSIAGITAIVIGIIAIAQRKGRALGVFALILGILGPFIWAVGLLLGGAAAGAHYHF